MIRHAEFIDAPFPVEKRDDIIEFMQAVRSYSDRRLLRSKCYICHTPFRIFDRPRTAGEWALIVERAQRRNFFFITERQGEQILEYITGKEKWTKSPPSPGTTEARALERKLVFEKKCGVCHTLDIIRMPHIERDEWPAVLERMGLKEPDLLSSEESLSTLPTVERALKEKEAFFSDFPHSTRTEGKP